MAGEERDARLILSAEDKASRTFTQVAKAIKDVRQELVAQAEAARRGEGDLNAINASLAKLRDLGKELVQDQSVLNSFDKMGERVTAATARLEKAQTALAAYEAELGASGAQNDKQSEKLTRLQDRVTAAQTAYDRAGKSFGVVADRMERAGLVAGQFEKQTDAIAAAAKDAAAGIAQATTAVDGFGAAQSAAAQERKALADASTLKSAVAASPLGPDDIAYVLSFSNAIEKLREVESLYNREQAASTALVAQDKAVRNAALAEVLAGNQQLTASIEHLQTVEREAAAAMAFKQIGVDAIAAAADVSRFQVTSQTAVESLAASVRRLSQPFAEVVSTVQGATSEIAAAEGVAAAKGTQALNAYGAALGQVANAQRALVGQAGLIDDFRAQEKAVAAAQAKFDEYRAEVTRLGLAISETDTPNAELVAQTKAAQAAMEAAGAAALSEKQKLEQLDAALKKAGIDSHNLAAAEKEIVSASERAAAAAGKLGQKQGGKGGFLGLNPYELQNLSYQINDVFTQLGSGTPVLQIVAQQGGQILQLFRGAIPFLLAWAGPILAAGAAFVILYAAVSRSNEQMKALKDFKGIFASMGDGANYSAQQFADASVKLQDLGLKAEAANQVLAKFAKEGLDQAGLTGFISTAENMNKTIGTEIPQAFTLLTAAATGGYDAILALNKETGSLTDAELEHIKTLFESGHAEEARAEALQITQDRQQEGINQMNGPLAAAQRGATLGWHNFLDALGNLGATVKNKVQPFLDYVSEKLTNIAIGFVYVTALLKGASQEAAKAEALGILNPKSGNAGAAVGHGPTQGGQDFLDQQQQQLKNAKAITREARLQVAAEQARLDAAKAGANNDQQRIAALNAQKILQVGFDKEDAAKGRRAASAANAAENKRKALAARIAGMSQEIDNSIAAMDAKVARSQNLSLAQRLSAVDAEYKKVFAAIAKYEATGGSKATAAADRARVTANIALIKQAETQSYYEGQLKDLSAQRSDILKGIQDQYAKGEISAADAVTQAKAANDQLSPQIEKMAKDALAFAESIAGANPPPQLVAFIASLKRTISDNAPGAITNSLLALTNQTVATQGQRINDVLQQRNDLVTAETNLVTIGVRTRAQAQTNIEAGYAATKPLLDQQVQAMKDLLATLDLTNPSMKLLYDTWQAKLTGIVAQQGYVSATFTQLKTGVDNAISQNALQGFDDIAKALGALVTGGASVGQTFAAIGMAALNFVGQTIGAIGRLILQMLVLDAIQKATGIPVAALAGAMNGSQSASSGIGGFLGGLFGKIFHDGGIGGQGTRVRKLPASTWAGAPRYHEGYTPGLKTGEVAAIIKTNEEVLTANDPRHAANGGLAPPVGGGGGMAGGLRQVLAFGDEQIAAAMQGPAGEGVVVTHIRRNRPAIREALGI